MIAPPEVTLYQEGWLTAQQPANRRCVTRVGVS